MPEKYQDEIEEILRRTGDSAPLKRPRDQQLPPEDAPESLDSLRDAKQSDGRRSRWLPLFSPGKVMLGGLIIFVIGALLQMSPLILIGLAVLIGAYLLFFIKPGSTSIEKRWRGRSVEEEGGGERFNVDKIKRWLRR